MFEFEYEHMSQQEKEHELIILEAEIEVYHRQRAQLEDWHNLLRHHRGELLKAMGMLVFPVEIGEQDV